MGQKVNPIGNRLGIIKGWDSSWYGGNDYAKNLAEDAKIRRYLRERLSNAGVSRIVIERTLKLVTVTIHTSRPGTIIGRGGQEVDLLRSELSKLTKKELNDVQVNIFEIKRPELDAYLVAKNIAHQLAGRASFRRAMKMAVASSMRAGAEGIKIQIAGRVGGAEMARTETVKEGRIPLHTFRADIDYALAEALTKVGIIGVKVWIFRGEVYGRRDLSPNFGLTQTNAAQGNRGGRSNRGGGRADNNRREREMLQPKKTKFRKQQKGRMKGIAHRGHQLAFGSFGIKTLEQAWLTGRQIEAARQAVTRYMKREGQIWIRVFPDKPVTSKPAEVRMGKGKGAPEGFVAPVTPGRIIIEADGVPLEVAREALRLAAQKLPVVTKFVIRRDYTENSEVFVR